MFEKTVQANFTNHKTPAAGYYLNKHTKKYLKKRKFEDERNTRDSNCITYNLLYMPRILKTDLRRQYPVMFVNAINSCNNEYIQGFVNKFLRDDTTFILQAPSRHIPFKAISTGREKCRNVLFDRINDAPDICFELLSSQFKLRSDGTCTCYATFKYGGTAVLHVNPDKIQTILNFSQEDSNGILTLPNIFDIEALNLLNPSSMIVYNNDKKNVLSTVSTQIVKDETDCWNEIHIPVDSTPFIPTNHDNNNNPHRRQPGFPFPSEESDYLYNILDMALYPGRPRCLPQNSTDTLLLGFPFQCIGNFTFQLDDESLIAFVPTPTPTTIPSPLPTLLPSTLPTLLPTSTVQPSISPTTAPTYLPSVEPSCNPTVFPTTAPTVSPSMQPSDVPTVQPSLSPTTAPTYLPSVEPSCNPTVFPTTAPTVSPSMQPSDVPTVQPSISPTTAPTYLPSVEPSCNPTVFPTTAPTVSPSMQPSDVPTVQPSLSPTTAPTYLPSVEPSCNPTVFPTTAPTVSPSMQPSDVPTVQP
eukprot:gene8662-9373_t